MGNFRGIFPALILNGYDVIDNGVVIEHASIEGKELNIFAMSPVLTVGSRFELWECESLGEKRY